MDNFAVELVDCENETLKIVTDVESILSDYEESMDKNSSMFTKLVLPELNCVISEEWDYTYIIWHQNNEVIETLAPYITASGLHHFND